MSIDALLHRSGKGLQETINGFLAALLDNGVVDALLLPVETPSGRNVSQALIRDTTRLGAAVPVSPVMPVNSATIVSNLTADEGAGRLGVVLRSCEIRALVELVKLKQASLEKLLVIGVDCPGSYTVPDYAAIAEAMGGPTPRAHRFMEQAMADGGLQGDGFEMRAACRICERPAPEFGDVRIGFIGLGPEDPLFVAVSEAVAEGRMDRLGLTGGRVDKRDAALERLVRARTEARDQAFAEVRKGSASPGGLMAYFAACLTCHNCSVTCPICYCKQCVFSSPTFDHSSSQYMRRAARKGALRMPSDTVLYHLTRMNHMASSCVGCGQCESGCPSRIPLTTIFRSVGQKVQALYDYQPGRSLEEEPPVMTFREEELDSVAR